MLNSLHLLNYECHRHNGYGYVKGSTLHYLHVLAAVLLVEGAGLVGIDTVVGRDIDMVLNESREGDGMTDAEPK